MLKQLKSCLKKIALKKSLAQSFILNG